MSKCYIPEISIRIIRKDEIINNLKSNFTFNKEEKKIICTNDGFYEINDNSILKYVILHKKEFIFENFIDSFTLLVDNTYVKKFGNIDFIPFESQEIEVTGSGVIVSGTIKPFKVIEPLDDTVEKLSKAIFYIGAFAATATVIIEFFGHYSFLLVGVASGVLYIMDRLKLIENNRYDI